MYRERKTEYRYKVLPVDEYSLTGRDPTGSVIAVFLYIKHYKPVFSIGLDCTGNNNFF